VKQKHKSLDDAAVGIPLRKNADIATVVLAAPKSRAVIAPVVAPPSKALARPVLEAAKFEAILELVDNSGRQFVAIVPAIDGGGSARHRARKPHCGIRRRAGGETFQLKNIFEGA
jgi:hypothetical protein